MENQDSGWKISTFTDHVKHGHTVEQTVEVMVLAWLAISHALSPVIGKGGVDALFHRSVEATIDSFPWLAPALHCAHPVLDTDTLRSVLLTQELLLIAASSDVLLQHFHHLLANLIGLSLTERLLRPALDPVLERLVTKNI